MSTGNLSQLHTYFLDWTLFTDKNSSLQDFEFHEFFNFASRHTTNKRKNSYIYCKVTL